jgi:hypothetical protein
MLIIAMSRVIGSAAKSAPGQKMRQESRRQRTSPTLFGRAGAVWRGLDSVRATRLFMMDVRELLLIIGFGRKAPALE